MSGQIRRSIALVNLLLIGLGAGVPTNAARTEDCLIAPNSPAPHGSHWYYRTDRAKQRKCWYLGTLDRQTPHSAASATSGSAPGTPLSAFEKPATASVGAPLSISPLSGAREESSPPTISEPPAPQSRTSSQTRARAAGPTLGAGMSTNNAVREDDCLAAPNSRAPEGSHWYYHTDRAKQRKCWH